MDDALRVHSGQALSHLTQHRQGPRHVTISSFVPLQRLALAEFHDQIEQSIRRDIDVGNGGQARVVKPRENLRFTHHAGHGEFVAAAREHFHCEVASVPNSLDVVHDAHRALSEIRSDSITFGDDGSRLERGSFTDEFVLVDYFVVIAQRRKQIGRVLLNFSPQFLVQYFDFGLFRFNGPNLCLDVAAHGIERSGEIRELSVSFDGNGSFDVPSSQARDGIEQNRLFADQFLLQGTIQLGTNGACGDDRNRQLFTEGVQNR